MVKNSLKSENDLLKLELSNLQASYRHLLTLLSEKTYESDRFIYLNNFHESEGSQFKRFDDNTNLWLFTLNYDPKLLHFSTEDDEREYYESIIMRSLKEDEDYIPVVGHGVFEHCHKSGKLHVHIMLKCYCPDLIESRMKSYLTNRRYMNVATDKRPVNDIDGLYDDYFVKEGGSLKFMFFTE